MVAGPPTPPRLAAAVYSFALHSPDESELGDLVEEYRAFVVPRRGPGRARLWFWSQVVRSLGPSLATSLRVAGLGRIAFALFGSAGVFYLLSSLALKATNALVAGPMEHLPRGWVYGVYLALSAASAGVTGRLVRSIARQGTPWVALALCFLVLLPELAAVVVGFSGEGWIVRVVWAVALPTAILVGSQAPRGWRERAG